MALQLHEWLDKFIEAHDLDKDIANTNNDGLFILHDLIHEERESYTYKKNYPNVKCLTLKEFTAYPKEELTDFLYERKTGYVIINLRYNSSFPHENLMSYLYNAIENKDLNVEQGAEAYIDKYGFSLSSVSYHKNILLDENFILNALEKSAFYSYNFDRI